MKQKETLTGTCSFCGQTRIVETNDQHEADRIATEECKCGNKSKSIRLCAENIDMLCGESAKDFGMDLVTEEVINLLKTTGELCIHEHIEAASFRLPDSTIAIKQTKDGVSVARKKVLSAKLES